MFVLRHERRLPSPSAALVQKVGQRVFVFTRMSRELDYYGLIFFHMGVIVTQARCRTEQPSLDQ